MILFFLACEGPTEPDDTATVDPLSWAVDEAGPYAVGYRESSATYTLLGEDRTIALGFWYPTEDTTGAEVRYTSGFPDTAAFQDASMAPPAWDGAYPVMVYSHGDRGYGATSPFLARHFASHGWVVVAPDHTGNTLMHSDDPRPTSIYVARPNDVTVALDALEGDPAFAAADTSRVLLSGHSFGAFTTWSIAGARFDGAEARCDAGAVPSGTCSDAERAAFAQGFRDTRVVATAPMAGNLDRNWFGDEGESVVDVPVAFFGGTDDDVGQADQFAEMSPSVEFTWVELEGACHQAFALGGCLHLDSDVGFRILNTWILAFARAHVRDDDRHAALLDGSEPVDPLVTVQTNW